MALLPSALWLAGAPHDGMEYMEAKEGGAKTMCSGRRGEEQEEMEHVNNQGIFIFYN